MTFGGMARGTPVISSRVRVGGRAGAVALTLLLASACGTEGEEPGAAIAGVYRAEIDQVLAGDPSELEQDVLADYHVSDAELAQAEDAFRVCMEAAGYEVEYDADGVTTSMAPERVNSFPDEDAAVAALQEDAAGCEEGTTLHIATLHHGMRENPSGTTPMQDLRACFEDAGVQDGAGIDDEQLAELVSSGTYTPDAAATACLEAVYGEWPQQGVSDSLDTGGGDGS